MSPQAQLDLGCFSTWRLQRHTHPGTFCTTSPDFFLDESWSLCVIDAKNKKQLTARRIFSLMYK